MDWLIVGSNDRRIDPMINRLSKRSGSSIIRLLSVGDKVRVFSDRHQCWFDDGIVVATYRDGVRVHYGKERYFGFALNKGNTKYFKASELEQNLRVLSSKYKLKKNQAVSS